MFAIVVVFLGVSLLFYCLLGGADFGAGILEFFAGKEFRQKGQKLTYDAIGPVWEANHIWLILVVVILFTGFPVIYSTVSVSLHIPLTVMLVGIVLRGCFFTFRHYDAFPGGRSHRYYTGIFVIASMLTPLFLGVIAGSLMLGRITRDTSSFAEAFVRPWLNYFSFSVGGFACCMFAFLAAVYLIGENKDKETHRYLLKQALYANLVTVIAGGLVFIAAEADGLPMMRLILNHWFSAACLALATVSLPVLWYHLRKGNAVFPRIAAGFQVCLILIAWLWMQYPAVVRVAGGADLTLYNSRAPDATMRALGWALLIGSLLILPALFYLLKAFKWNPETEPTH